MSTTPPPNARDDPISSNGIPLTSTMTPSTRAMSTTSTTHSNDNDDDSTQTPETCRICRSEATPTEPLFHPCKCSGSIKHVHQECLMEWLSHSHKKHCELCKTPFRFTKLYNPDMPDKLPWIVFVRRAAWHGVWMVGSAGRGVLVGMVWLVLLPWLIRWSWRWIFWGADAGWARDAWVRKMRREALAAAGQGNGTVHGSEMNSTSTSFGPAAYEFILNIFGFYLGTVSYSPDDPSTSVSDSPVADTSLLSSWTYISQLTTSPNLNRVILDIFEGQLITCVVIVGFILVFLIREWVVQQQPLVNLDNLNNVQQQLLEAAARAEAENVRLRRQQELLEQARRRLLELQAESQAFEKEGLREWKQINESIDLAVQSLHSDSEEERLEFKTHVKFVLEGAKVVRAQDIPRPIVEKLAIMSDDDRAAWDIAHGSELSRLLDRVAKAQTQPELDDPAQRATDTYAAAADAQDTEPSTDLDQAQANPHRPRMPDRDFSSRATQIQRLLEEAEGIFTPQELAMARDATPQAQADMRPNSTPAEQLEHSRAAQASEAEPEDYDDELPITNAGPDAKINIRRRGFKGKAPVLSEPKSASTADVLRRHAEDQALKRLEDEIKADDAASTRATRGSSRNSDHESADGEPASDDVNEGEASATESAAATAAAPNENPFHPEGPAPDPSTSTRASIGRDIATDVLGLDGPEQIDEFHQAARAAPAPRPAADEHNMPNDGDEAEEQPPRRPQVAVGMFQRMVDWFWGDIALPPAAAQQEAAIPAEEERLLPGGQEAPFVPVANGRLVPAVAEEEEAPPPLVPAAAAHPDPDLLAVAQAAGLDADAMDDAEDLEGIFELIGLQGPLLGLFQTSTFCTVLVTGTVLGAVGLPYLWGKLVLSFIGDPTWFLIKMPLLTISFIGDFLVDLTLLVGGWSVLVSTLASDLLLSLLGRWVARLQDVRVAAWIADFATATATKSGTRLQHLFLTQEPLEKEILNWNWAFLGASVHAHASLRQVQVEINGIMSWMGGTVTRVVETISSGSVIASSWKGLQAMGRVSEVPAHFTTILESVKQYTAPLMHSLGLLKTGSINFETTTSVPLDPTLIYWSTSDRTLAVTTGYLSLALLAALYVALDTPITRSEAGRKTEKQIRDTFKQAGGVLKVILIISIEMLVFPFYCGLLLDLAFLPLFRDASVASRWAGASTSPYLFCFAHWFVGTCYMFHFALFVGMCRKILRKGVLWFIRDPDDPTFHPVRDVLERNVTTQLRKIAFSALVYGALVILCLGGVIWTIGKIFDGMFPILWLSTEPVFEFPLDLLLYNAVTPLLVRLFKPSDAVSAMYAWWLRRCARGLRLSHFMFGDRRVEEEGNFIGRSWVNFLTLRGPADLDTAASKVAEETGTGVDDNQESPKLQFKKDGKYVLTPCNDQYRPPKPGEAFLHSEPANSVNSATSNEQGESKVYIADAHGKKNDHFAKIYIPPFFRLRVTLFMVCLWIFSAFTGLCATLVPLIFGRRIFHAIMPEAMQEGRINDIYAYTVGAYILAAVLYTVLKGTKALTFLRDSTPRVDIKAWTAPVVRFSARVLKCLYVYGFVGVVLPTLFALILQFYLILPLHTYAVSIASTGSKDAMVSALNSTLSLNATNPVDAGQNFTIATGGKAGSMASSLPTLASHTIHILQDYCLGLLYVRLASRLVVSTPTSRAAEAFRRITARGYLNPDVKLATRFLVLPLILFAALLLLAPPAAAQLFISTATYSSMKLASILKDEVRTNIFRYSYPAAAAMVVVGVCASEVGEATSRWRARIRDEVYLVGERLHNFGEKRPPVGTRSVLRREK
ncbi:hypothetical protein LTR86_004577 [Recurvomyces mirabilis]|nr:hypothetical protein LTR86_004577 [Recurvomyces mirabilis]